MATSKPQAIQLIAFLEHEEDGELLQKVLVGEDIKAFEIIKGGVREAIEYFSHHRSSHYLIIDISESELPVSDLNRLAEVCEPGINVIAVGSRNDVGLYRDLMKLGIFEYVVKPLFPEIVGRATRHMIYGEEKGKKGEAKKGKVIAVAGSRGGVGSTFLAVNIAALLSVEKSRRVVVVDLDFQFGTVSLYSNVKTNFGLRNALEDPERLDPVFLERLLASVNERFSVLSTEEPLEEPISFKVEGVERLLNYLAKLFHYVIVDLPHIANDFTRGVISEAHFMLLVTDSSLAGLRDTGRLIRSFGKEEIDHRLILIMNKFVKDEKESLTLSSFEETLKRKIDHVVPYDALLLRSLINQGKTIVEVEGVFAHSLREIVDDIQGVSRSTKEVRGLEKFLNWIKFK